MNRYGITAPRISWRLLHLLLFIIRKFPRLRSYKRKHNASLFYQQDRLGFHQIRFKVTYFPWTGQYKMVISIDFRWILFKTKWDVIKTEYICSQNQTSQDNPIWRNSKHNNILFALILKRTRGRLERNEKSQELLQWQGRRWFHQLCIRHCQHGGRRTRDRRRG